MKILIIEDDDFKAEKLEYYFMAKFTNVDIDTVLSLSDATDAIDHNDFDLVIVDMGIPSHPAEQGQGAPMSLPTGGIDIILELSLMGRRDKCVVITQFPSIEMCGDHYSVNIAKLKFRELLNCEVEGCIHYVEDDDKWISELDQILGINDESSHFRR